MSLLVISYPNITKQAARWIADTRRRHIELHHSVVAPHFTLVFPLHSLDERQVAKHVRETLSRSAPIPFVLRCCLVVKNDSDDNYFVLLVPDEGFSNIVKLHNSLYTGILAPHLRLDIPFIPHITIGFSTDASACKAIADDLNNEQFEHPGTISSLDLLRKDSDKITSVERFPIPQLPS
jgi:2'-5' RNA ligase